MFSKTLCQNEKDLDSFISSVQCDVPRTVCTKYLPDKYPCVIAYHRVDNPNGPYEIEYDFIYLSDFEV